MTKLFIALLWVVFASMALATTTTTSSSTSTSTSLVSSTHMGVLATAMTTTGNTNSVFIGPDSLNLSITVANTAGTIAWSVQEAPDCTTANFQTVFECATALSYTTSGSANVGDPVGCYRVLITTCSSCSATVTYRTNP